MKDAKIHKQARQLFKITFANLDYALRFGYTTSREHNFLEIRNTIDVSERLTTHSAKKSTIPEMSSSLCISLKLITYNLGLLKFIARNCAK